MLLEEVGSKKGYFYMIWKAECKKLIKHPMIWCLFIIFIMININLIWKNIGEDLKTLHVTYEVIQNDEIDDSYYLKMRQIYESLDMTEVLKRKQQLYHYYPEGSYKNFIEERYERLNERVDEIIETREADGKVYPGSIFRLHNKLYVKILRPVFIELGFLILFAILFIMDYERMNNCSDLVYSSGKGRKIQLIKWGSGIVVGLGFGIMILAITLFIWFSMIEFKGFWYISISSALMTEPRGTFIYPFITFNKMTIQQYLIATILTGILLVIIVGMITGVVQILLKNSYMSFIAVLIFLLIGLSLSGHSTVSWLDVVLSWNPSDLWYRVGNWFMEGSLVSNFKGAEIISISVQMVSWGIIGKLSYQKFLKTDY